MRWKFILLTCATLLLAALQVVESQEPQESAPEPFPSVTPRYTFPETLEEQEAALATNELMQRFAASRQAQAGDRYRPAFHFVSPESQLNDPNGLCYWQGQWHMFYQAYPADEFPAPEGIPQRRQHWGHAVSDDLVHWRDLPYAIYPGIEKMCFSGGTVVDDDKVVAFYPGIAAGQMLAVADDPLLLNWEKIPGNPVMPNAGDSCIWKEGDTYYGLLGIHALYSSTDLVNWQLVRGDFTTSPTPIDGGACPTLRPIGDKHILLFFSHATGGQYLLGDYDPVAHQFNSYENGRFNHGRVSPGGVHAPSGASDGAGGVVNILNINDGRHSDNWDQIMSLAQHLTLGPDNRLRIAPVAAVETLRDEHVHVDEMVLPANEEIVLEGVQGDTMELNVEIDPGEARWVQLNVLRSPNAEEQTSITFYNFDRTISYWYRVFGTLCIDSTHSSTLDDAWMRPPECARLERGGETLRLRVFIDRSVIEVYANEKLYMAQRVYPGREDSIGVSLRAQGQDAVLKSLDAWQMQPIWPVEEAAGGE